MPKAPDRREERLLEALDAAYGYEKPNLAALARAYEVSYPSLKRRWHGVSSRSDREPTNRKLDRDQEAAVIAYIDCMDSLGVSARLKQITQVANSILARAHKDSSIPPPIVSDKWAERFRDRHPSIVKVKQKAFEIDRVVAHEPKQLEKYFERLGKVIQENGIHVSCP
jgi:hypothetical protein